MIKLNGLMKFKISNKDKNGLLKLWKFKGVNGGLNNGWNLIMENIMCGDGNHEWYIEFITSGEATSDKFNISQVITITTSDIFHYQIPAVV